MIKISLLTPGKFFLAPSRSFVAKEVVRKLPRVTSPEMNTSRNVLAAWPKLPSRSLTGSNCRYSSPQLGYSFPDFILGVSGSGTAWTIVCVQALYFPRSSSRSRLALRRRSPRFSLCSRKIRKKLRLFGRLTTHRRKDRQLVILLRTVVQLKGG